MRLINADEIRWADHYDSDGNLSKYKVAYSDEMPPTVDAVPVQYILTTIREWNRDGYAESAEALEILVMNWDKENTEWAERKCS